MNSVPLSRSFDNCVSEEHIDVMVQDCKVAFDQKSLQSNDENYSTGMTYFLKANEAPICGLEEAALSIFHFHTKGLSFDPKKSGCEWWTQYIEADDDIGFHWDRDYDLEEENGLHVYPHLGTVTYLTNLGGPTIVLDREGSEKFDDFEAVTGEITKVIVSSPAVGKHICFNGKMLHAAPSDFLDDDQSNDSLYTNEDDDDSDEESEDEEKEEGVVKKIESKRITFLVNIWVDHIPSHAVRYSNDTENKLSLANGHFNFTFAQEKDFNNVEIPSTSKNIKKNDVVVRRWRFTEGSKDDEDDEKDEDSEVDENEKKSWHRYEVCIPLWKNMRSKLRIKSAGMNYLVSYSSGANKTCPSLSLIDDRNKVDENEIDTIDEEHAQKKKKVN